MSNKRISNKLSESYTRKIILIFKMSTQIKVVLINKRQNLVTSDNELIL